MAARAVLSLGLRSAAVTPAVSTATAAVTAPALAAAAAFALRPHSHLPPVVRRYLEPRLPRHHHDNRRLALRLTREQQQQQQQQEQRQLQQQQQLRQQTVAAVLSTPPGYCPATRPAAAPPHLAASSIPPPPPPAGASAAGAPSTAAGVRGACAAGSVKGLPSQPAPGGGRFAVAAGPAAPYSTVAVGLSKMPATEPSSAAAAPPAEGPDMSAAAPTEAASYNAAPDSVAEPAAASSAAASAEETAAGEAAGPAAAAAAANGAGLQAEGGLVRKLKWPFMGTCAFQMTPTCTLVLHKGDITKWFVDGKTDAIVNAANEQMLGGGGVDGAIHRAAGPALLRMCRAAKVVKPAVRCPTGEAVTTGSALLPVSHVIHTVGPIYGTVRNPAGLLSSAYKSSMLQARQHGLKYIAFPAISCGIYSYPLDEAADVSLRTLHDNSDDVDEVHFLLFGASEMRAWQKAAQSLFQALDVDFIQD